MHGKFGLLSSGKASSHRTALPSLFFYSVQYVSSCLHATGCQPYFFTTPGYGIFNVRTLGACRYTLRGVRHKQVCTRVDSELGTETLFVTLPRQGSEPYRVSGYNYSVKSPCSNSYCAKGDN